MPYDNKRFHKKEHALSQFQSCHESDAQIIPLLCLTQVCLRQWQQTNIEHTIGELPH